MRFSLSKAEGARTNFRFFFFFFTPINAPTGFPGVFPQKPGQDEDQMTPNNVKTGYIDKGIIQVQPWIHWLNATKAGILEENFVSYKNGIIGI